jgi:hypothetical protein
MRTNFSQVARVFFTPETLFPFIIGAIFLAVLGNSVTQILFSVFGTSAEASLYIALGSVLIFGSSVWLFGKGLEKLRSPQMNLNKQPPIKHQGLILLVSRLEPCKAAIDFHSPVLKCCWLICSTTTLSIANELKQEFPNIKIPAPIVVNDVYDPIEFFQEIKRIYRDLPEGWTEEEVIADFTGMTAQASVGMVLASLSPEHQLQYTPAEFSDGKPTGRSLMPIEIVLKKQSNHQGNSINRFGG